MNTEEIKRQSFEKNMQKKLKNIQKGQYFKNCNFFLTSLRTN